MLELLLDKGCVSRPSQWLEFTWKSLLKVITEIWMHSFAVGEVNSVAVGEVYSGCLAEKLSYTLVT